MHYISLGSVICIQQRRRLLDGKSSNLDTTCHRDRLFLHSVLLIVGCYTSDDVNCVGVDELQRNCRKMPSTVKDSVDHYHFQGHSSSNSSESGGKKHQRALTDAGITLQPLILKLAIISYAPVRLSIMQYERYSPPLFCVLNFSIQS